MYVLTVLLYYVISPNSHTHTLDAGVPNMRMSTALLTKTAHVIDTHNKNVIIQFLEVRQMHAHSRT